MKDLLEDLPQAVVALEAQLGREAYPELGGRKHEFRRQEQVARGRRVLREGEGVRARPEADWAAPYVSS